MMWYCVFVVVVIVVVVLFCFWLVCGFYMEIDIATCELKICTLWLELGVNGGLVCGDYVHMHGRNHGGIVLFAVCPLRFLA